MQKTNPVGYEKQKRTIEAEKINYQPNPLIKNYANANGIKLAEKDTTICSQQSITKIRAFEII